MFRLPQLENWRDALALCLLLMGLQQLASAGYIQGKATLAQVLIARAWERSLEGGGMPVRPWPWADTWPVARLEVPSRAVDLYVLAGARGHALAFGPGFEVASAEPGEPGISVIGGHRDTHFAFLENLGRSESLYVTRRDGRRLDYRVTDKRVIDAERDPLPQAPLASNELLLVTCFPFDALSPGGSLRYLVSARPTSKDTDNFQLQPLPGQGAYEL